MTQRARKTAGRAARQLSGVPVAAKPLAGGLDSDELDVLVRDERVEDAHRVRAAADAGDHRRRKSTRPLQHLRPCFDAYDRLEVPHHSRIRRWTDHGPDDVMALVDIRHPISNGFARRVL